MINRVEFSGLFGTQKSQDKHPGFQGISPQFFGPPNAIDQRMDQQLCGQLGIDTSGMNRTEVKANILSSLTGQPVDQMQNFFSNFSDKACKQDMQFLQSNGIEPSGNPNYMQSMAENKAAIANLLISNAAQNNGSVQQGAQTQGQGGPPPEVLQMLQQLGLQPTGSLQGDMAAIQQKLQEMQTQNADSSQQTQQGQGKGQGGAPQIPAEIQSIMNSVGVSPTGSKEGDYSAVMTKIQTMMATATDDSEKQRAMSLLTQAQNAFSNS